MASFERVLGRDLSNPIPGYAPAAERGVVPVHAATSMDAPNPDAGEEHPHANAQLFGTVAPEDNRFVSYEQMKPPFNAPDDRRVRRHGSTVTQGGIRDLGSLKAVTPPPRKRSHHDNLL